jgi:hypothetical protein
VVAHGNVNTSGDLHVRPRNAEPNTTAFAAVAPLPDVTVRSTTSNPAKARVMDQGVIITCCPTQRVEADSKCYVMHTMPKSPLHKRLHVPLQDLTRAARLRPKPKLRSESWLFETAMDG